MSDVQPIDATAAVQVCEQGEPQDIVDAKYNLIVKAELKRMIKDQDHQLSSDLIDTLNRRVGALVTQAAVRAEKNGRKQIRPHDL